jgi:hypothetical protein
MLVSGGGTMLVYNLLIDDPTVLVLGLGVMVAACLYQLLDALS